MKGGNQASGGNSKSNDSRNAKLCAEVGKYDDGSRNTSFNNAENGSARMYGGIDLDQLDAQLGALDDEGSSVFAIFSGFIH